MFIQSDFAEDSRHQNVDPAIIVEGGGIAYTNDAIGNSVNLDIYKLAMVQQHYQFLARSTINIHCIAGSDDAAEELGFEVAMFMQSMRPISATMLELQEVGMPQQSKPQLMNRSEWAGKYDSVVSINYAFAIRRKHTPIDVGELLKDLIVNLEPDKEHPKPPKPKPDPDVPVLPKPSKPEPKPVDPTKPEKPKPKPEKPDVIPAIETSPSGDVTVLPIVSEYPDSAAEGVSGIFGGPTSAWSEIIIDKSRS